MSLSISSRWRRCAAAALGVPLAAYLAACSASDAAGPPLVELGPARSVTVVAASVPPDPPEAGGSAPDAAALDLCELARDADLAADLGRWPEYRQPLAGAMPSVDVDALPADLGPQAVLTPRRIAAMDLVWDTVDARCGVEPLRRQCRSLLFMALADPLGRGASGEDPGEVEVAFDVALANLDDLRSATEDPALLSSLAAHHRVTAAARVSFEATGFRPEGLGGLEPLVDDLVALTEPELLDPLEELERACGMA
jgi:hypothetical protein